MTENALMAENRTGAPRPGRLRGTVAIVTGAASGIGAATAERFVAEGARVTLTDVDGERGAALAERLGDTARFVEVDVASDADWKTALDVTQSHFGAVTALVNNAGIFAGGYIESLDDQIWTRSIAVNLVGPLNGMRHVLPVMRDAGGGSIVNVSSLQGREGEPGTIPYTAAKFGLRGISKAAAVELGRYGIRVNTIFPGLIATPATAGIPEGNMGRIPLRRFTTPTRAGEPADVAGLAAFLASDESSFITGAEITVDGAKSVRFPTSSEDYSAIVDRISRSGSAPA
jgi:3alpha(or 20beta)-hydroxysteroid dehydrogenase